MQRSQWCVVILGWLVIAHFGCAKDRLASPDSGQTSGLQSSAVELEIGAAFGSQQIISELESANELPTSVSAVDLDGDSDTDVVVAYAGNAGKLSWFENDGSENFGDRQIIADTPFGMESQVADLDGDSDPDVLSIYLLDEQGQIAWHENIGAGQFEDPQSIASDVDGPSAVETADLTGDTDLDVVVALSDSSQIAWFENDGSAGFGDIQVVSSEADGVSSLDVADLDGDDDTDILAGYGSGDAIEWFENQSDGNFVTGGVVSADVDSENVLAADLDGDSDIDVAATTGDEILVWYENDGAGEFGDKRVLVDSEPWMRGTALDAADLDGDGDLDLIAGGGGGGTGGVFRCENNGEGEFTQRLPVASTGASPMDVESADINGDLIPDVLYSHIGNEVVAWHEQCDDADQDGVCDADDNCPSTWNRQDDLDDDGVGDACDSDTDGDDVPDEEDDCPMEPADGDSVDGCPDEPTHDVGVDTDDDAGGEDGTDTGVDGESNVSSDTGTDAGTDAGSQSPGESTNEHGGCSQSPGMPGGILFLGIVAAVALRRSVDLRGGESRR